VPLHPPTQGRWPPEAKIIPQIRITARPLFTGVLQFPFMHFTPLKMGWIEWKQLISEKFSEKLTIPLDFLNCRG
jgi:hypothetical protein